MKKCKSCKTPKELSEFYKQKASKDGHQNKCKKCSSEHQKKHRSKPHIKSTIKEYQKKYFKTTSGKSALSRSRKKTNSKHPNATKSRAYYAYYKDESSILDYCERCGDIKNIEAHHCDYNKPMEVIYLCKCCHIAWHKIKEPLNRVTGIFTI